MVFCYLYFQDQYFMKKIKLLPVILMFVFAFTSCDPSESKGSSQNDDTFAENFGNGASKDFIGQVVDTNNHPIQNATVTIGTSTIQTDVNGVFIINNASVHEKFAYIKVAKAGYIDGSRAMVPTSGKNNVKIMMIPNSPLETIQSGVESEVALPSGTKVTFDGAFQDENGNPYSGSVSVAMYHLLPGNQNIDKLMPGMLYAQTKNNQEAVLETFGMLNVELRGSGGQKLNLMEGHTAEITMKIDDSQTGTAPSSIPLWHFDEAKGYWKEDGEATKVGNNYVGEVSHFSWWNCDQYSSTAMLTLTIVDVEGNPISNLGVKLTVNAVNFSSYVQLTDSSGSISGVVPSNEVMTLVVYNQCNDIVYTSQIGPFTSSTILPQITLNTSSTPVTRITGSLIKCNSSKVTNGYVKLARNGRVSFSTVDNNGNFSFREIYCPASPQFTLTGIDFDNYQSTGDITYNAIEGITSIGGLMACNTISEFVSYKVDDYPPQILTNYIMAEWSVSEHLFYAGANNSDMPPAGYASDTNYFTFVGNSKQPGTYQNMDFFASFSFGNIGSLSGSFSGPNNVKFHLNKFGSVGDYIDITCEGTFDDWYGVTRHISAIAHLKRHPDN